MAASQPPGIPTPSWCGWKKSVRCFVPNEVAHLDTNCLRLKPTTMGLIPPDFLLRVSINGRQRKLEQHPLDIYLPGPCLRMRSMHWGVLIRHRDWAACRGCAGDVGRQGLQLNLLGIIIIIIIVVAAAVVVVDYCLQTLALFHSSFPSFPLSFC